MSTLSRVLPDHIELSPAADFHSHLRDGDLTELVVPTIRQGGCDSVYVMPNLQPPITTVAAALAYRERLQSLDPDINFLMTLYLHPSITPSAVAEAAAAGIAGVKVYPKGVTTSSEDGVIGFEEYYPVFEAMQEHNMVLNLHGEVPSTLPHAFVADDNRQSNADVVTVLNAEAMFLPMLHKLHTAFPRLRIVLEHCSTREALEAVRACGPNVGATITAHHLWMTVDDWCGNAFNFCKPVAKTPADRVALVKAVVDRSGKFFFGSDSAPHAVEAKKGKLAAGCFTQKYATQLVVAAVDEGLRQGWIEDVTVDDLDEFLSGRGRRFYEVEAKDKRKIVLEKRGERISDSIKSENTEVVPFRSGEEIMSLRWIETVQ